MTVSVEIEGGVAVVTLDRPETRNAITMAMRARLWEAFEGFETDPKVRAVVLTGASGHFSSGTDTGELGTGGVPGSMERMHTLGRLLRSIYHLKKPTIAAVPGLCLGMAWGMALACDLVVAAPAAKFGLAFRGIGLTPDAGAMWSLARLIGPMQAKALYYSGRTVLAEEALAMGLVLEVPPQETYWDRVLERAADLAAGPTIAFGLAKRQVDLAATASFDQFLDAEATMQPIASRTEDHVEGIAAAREKRKPAFRGE